MAPTVAEAILGLLTGSQDPVRAKDVVQAIQEKMGASESAIRSELASLVKQGRIAQPKYAYYAAESGAADVSPAQLRAEVDALRAENARLRAQLAEKEKPTSPKGRLAGKRRRKDSDPSVGSIPEPEGIVTEALLYGALMEIFDEEGFTVDLLIRGRSNRMVKSLLRRFAPEPEEEQEE